MSLCESLRLTQDHCLMMVGLIFPEWDMGRGHKIRWIICMVLQVHLGKGLDILVDQ